MNREELGNIMTVRSKPAPLVVGKGNGFRYDEGESKMEPHVGLEFNSAEEAQEFYSVYGNQVGFKIRIGQLYRSRTDGSVISRRFVCSKEGYQSNSRTGCAAFIRVQKVESGKWVITNINKEHNHGFETTGEVCPQRIHKKSFPSPKPSSGGSSRRGIRSHEDDSPSSVVDTKRIKYDKMDIVGEPQKGLEFNSANEAYKFYYSYASNMGFRIRIGQLFRSKHDGSITSRRFVCSKEGHQHPSRVGCGAYMRIQKQDTGRWVVDRLQKEHNHEIDTSTNVDHSRTVSDASKGYNREEGSSVLENLDLVETNEGLSLVRRVIRESNIGSDWYNMLLDYFQSCQAEDTGFFYAVEMRDGKIMNIFWADSHSRFSCAQFGDAVVFDTMYRRFSYSVPFASFVGVNHHRQPVLLGCAVIADESEESFTWIFQAWLRAMSGCRPVSIIADQDRAIQNSIAQVFPGTHHRFSAWQILDKEQENLGALLSMDAKFKCEYGTCIFQSQTASEYDSAWNMLMNKYNLRDNMWLKEMYRMRKSWVPLHIKGTFFAGIRVDGSLRSYFGPLLTPQTPLEEFIVRYEKALQQHREEERKEDFNSFNVQQVLHTKDPIEEQCRKLYTMTMFKVFQNELLECYGYTGIKINAEGAIVRYLVQKSGGNGGGERTTVAFNSLNLNINCSCKMFEFEGVLCRHALKIFQMMNIRELPSRYILHRWTKTTKYCIMRDDDSDGDLKPLMMWSLREEARYFIEAGSTSVERYKLAYEVIQEGRRSLCWQN